MKQVIAGDGGVGACRRPVTGSGGGDNVGISGPVGACENGTLYLLAGDYRRALEAW